MILRLIGIGVLCTGVGFGAGQWAGRVQAAANAETRVLQSTIEQLRERGLINEAVATQSDCDLARELNAGVVCDEPTD